MRATISNTVVIHIDLTQEEFDTVRKEWDDYQNSEPESEEEFIPATIQRLIETICREHHHA